MACFELRAQTESRTESMIKAAEKHLQFEGVTLEQANENLQAQVVDSQATCGGS